MRPSTTLVCLFTSPTRSAGHTSTSNSNPSSPHPLPLLTHFSLEFCCVSLCEWVSVSCRGALSCTAVISASIHVCPTSPPSTYSNIDALPTIVLVCSVIYKLEYFDFKKTLVYSVPLSLCVITYEPVWCTLACSLIYTTGCVSFRPIWWLRRLQCTYNRNTRNNYNYIYSITALLLAWGETQWHNHSFLTHVYTPYVDSRSTCRLYTHVYYTVCTSLNGWMCLYM